MTAGDTWEWDVAVDGFDGGTLTYAFRGVSSTGLTSTPTPIVAGIAAVRISAVDTAGLPAGSYAFAAYAELAGRRREVRSGRVLIRPNLLMLAEAGTAAERILAAIDARMQGRVDEDMESTTINGRSITSIPIPDLLKLRNYYASLVARERGHGGPVASYIDLGF